jgi:hypothetical protein
MAPLSSSELKELGLPPSGGSWCGVWVDVPRNAELLDFVFSDRWAPL